jgi:hypothetical protein
MKLKYNSSLVVFLAYIALTLFFTYPLILGINSFLPGMGDNWQTCWLFWWFKYSFLELGKNPYFTDYLFHPIGMSLGSFDTMPINSFLSVPLQILFGLIVTYNILFLLTFIISAFGVYLLANYLTKNKLASFISGVIFAFSPQRMGFSMGYLNLLSVHWMPFYILFLIKFIKHRTNKYAIASAIFLVLTCLSSWYFMVLSLVFTFLLLIWMHEETLKFLKKRNIKPLAIFFSIAFIGIFPFLYPLLMAEKAGLLEAYTHQADLAAYFIPFKFHTFFGKYVKFIQLGAPPSPPSDMTLYLGFTVLFLIAFCIVKCKNHFVNFWKVSALFFFLWSLGSNIIFLGNSTPIPLPLFFMKYVPLVNLFSRLPVVSVMFFLSSSILSSYAIAKMLQILKKYPKCITVLFALLLFFLIVFEYVSIPMHITYVKIPDFYRKISEEKEDYAILELPVGECPGKGCPSPIYSNFTYSFYMYYQTLHNKKILGGYLARNIPKEVVTFTENTSVIMNLKHPSKPLPEKIIQNISIAKSILNGFNIKYVILHKQFQFRQFFGGAFESVRVSSSYLERVKQILDKIFGNEILYEDNQIIVYKVNNFQ